MLTSGLSLTALQYECWRAGRADHDDRDEEEIEVEKRMRRLIGVE